jgi:hypothetical protein
MLYEKIKTLYPSLTEKEFDEYIILQNDLDGKGDYIKVWNHPTLPKPTEEQLNAS